MSLSRPENHLSARRAETAPRETIVGSHYRTPATLATQRLRDMVAENSVLELSPAQILPAPAKPAPVTAKQKPVKDKKNSLLDKPYTLRRKLFWGSILAIPAAAIFGAPHLDKYLGGKLGAAFVDAAIDTAVFVYTHTHEQINAREAIEWGVWGATVLHTDPVGLQAKYDAGRNAREKHPTNDGMLKITVLPVVFAADIDSFGINYAYRSAIIRRNHPDMAKEERGRILALGFLKDVHAAWLAPDTLKNIRLSDMDILRFLDKNPAMLNKAPEDLRDEIKKMIAHVVHGRNVQPRGPQPLRLEEWQRAALEAEVTAEVGPPITPAEQAQIDRVAAESNRQERLRKQRAAAFARSHDHRHETARQRIAQDELRGKMNAVAQPPSTARVVWCATITPITGASKAKCLLGQ